MAGQFDLMTANSMRRFSLARSPQPNMPYSPAADVTSQEVVGGNGSSMSIGGNASGQLSMGILGIGLITLAAVYIATRSKQK
jgi:hypothetical protein